MEKVEVGKELKPEAKKVVSATKQKIGKKLIATPAKKPVKSPEKQEQSTKKKFKISPEKQS